MRRILHPSHLRTCPSCPMPEDSEQSKFTLAFAIGGIVAYNISGGIILGYLLDRWLGTVPWLTITGLVIGTIVAIVGILRIMSKLNK
jgi:F0F1-type ATP synthase assembly protein I